jgi:hypothetical protein
MIRRREFIAGLGSVATWPLAVQAQQAAMPVIGWLSGRNSETDAHVLPAFRRGLNRTFHRIVNRYGGDHRTRNLSCAEQFRVMAFAQLPTAKVCAISKCVWQLKPASEVPINPA